MSEQNIIEQVKTIFAEHGYTTTRKWCYSEEERLPAICNSGHSGFHLSMDRLNKTEEKYKCCPFCIKEYIELGLYDDRFNKEFEKEVPRTFKPYKGKIKPVPLFNKPKYDL